MLRSVVQRHSRPLAAGLLRPLQARGLCAPAVPLAEQVATDIEDMKAKIASSAGEGMYTPSAFEADLNAGKVDYGKLSMTLGDFSPEARKTMSKLSKETADMLTKMSAPEEELDWSSWEAKLADPSAIAKVKAICDEAASTLETELAKDTSFADLEKEISEGFKGAGGLFELASKEEKAAEAGMLQCVADMEKLTVDIDGVSQVTIADILEREPELRAEIEEEIKNNVWAP